MYCLSAQKGDFRPGAVFPERVAETLNGVPPAGTFVLKDLFLSHCIHFDVFLFWIMYSHCRSFILLSVFNEGETAHHRATQRTRSCAVRCGKGAVQRGT